MVEQIKWSEKKRVGGGSQDRSLELSDQVVKEVEVGGGEGIRSKVLLYIARLPNS